MNYDFKNLRGYCLSVLCVIIVTWIFWIAYGCDWEQMYSPSPYHRLQAAAMLDGHFELSRSIENITWDLAWHDGRVHQVWGLGIGMWILPFEAVFRWCGGRDLPDRIPLLVAVALLAWYVARTALMLVERFRSWILGALFVNISLAFPPLWNLVMGYKLVYEDTVLYATILAVALLMGLVRCFLLRSSVDFFIVCILGGLSSLVRPTFGVYGALAAFFSGLALFQFKVVPFKQRVLLQVGAGWSLVLAGFVFLFYSNWLRFGSPWEFGHRLTVSGDMIVYATRFDNPFARVGFIDAAKELFSWIFLSPFHRSGNWCAPDMMPWQADVIRWRDVYQPTFDPSWLLVLGNGFATGAAFLWRRSTRARQMSINNGKPVQNLIAALLSWFTVASLALSFFYLHFPTVSTRYILDFSPAFFGIFVVVLLLNFRRFPVILAALTLLWLAGEQAVLFVHPGVGGVFRQMPRSFLDRPGLPVPGGRKISDFHGRYTEQQRPEQTNIRCNGYGWLGDGLGQGIVTVMVDRPRFLEICLSEHQEGLERPAASGLYRAKIDNMELAIQSLTHETSGTNSFIRVRFGIPQRILQQNSDQVVCICFTKSLEDADLASVRHLYEIRWR